MLHLRAAGGGGGLKNGGDGGLKTNLRSGLALGARPSTVPPYYSLPRLPAKSAQPHSPRDPLGFGMSESGPEEGIVPWRMREPIDRPSAAWK